MTALQHQIKEFDSLMDLLEDLDREGIQGRERLEIFKRFMAFRARMKRFPYSGSFELTPLCNFDCKMCYVHLTKNQAEKEAALLSTEQWIDLMSQAIDAGMMCADLTGGECLSYPGFKDIYMYLVSRGILVSILTNGQLITEEMADLFKMYPPAIVQITVYGSNNDAYEHVTGRRAFDDVILAIKRLKKRNIQMLLTITPSQYMQKDTHELLELLRGLDVPYGIGTGSLPARENTGRLREEFAPEADLYVKLHLDECEYNEELKHKIKGKGIKNQIIVDRIPKGFRPSGKIPCAAGVATFHINWKGMMQPCVPFHTVTTSVYDKGFRSAWEYIRKRMESYEIPDKCVDCPSRMKCVACAGEKTFGILNGPLNEDVCDRTHGYISAGIV